MMLVKCRVCGVEQNLAEVVDAAAYVDGSYVCPLCTRPMNLPPHTLRRSFITDVGETSPHCTGCGEELHIGQRIYYRLGPMQAFCDDCGDSGKPYGL